ncbi:MAG: 30S ribosome-binding factor RbfA [Nitrospinota bacterium]|nr:30S ribosome-binding factor RbfA [Nitrospinota bacterium]
MNDYGRISRSERVATLVKKELSELILTHVKDPRVKSVILSNVVITKDLREAKVYFSRYDNLNDNEDNLKESLEGLNKASKFLRVKLGENLNLRNVPALKFFIDNSISNISEIEKLLGKLSADPEL